MARPSRPPGFDMTYKPKKATFAPPLVRRLPAMIYFGVACLIGITVLVAPLTPHESWLYQYVVQRDYNRIMGSQVFAILIFASAAAAMLRQTMSGVVVHTDGIETREVIAFGLPKFKRYAWAQIDRVRIPSTNPAAIARQAVDRVDNPLAGQVRLDLWDGTKVWLPSVQKASELGTTIERVALARAIPIEGGSGMLDELGSPFDDHAEQAA